jgi:hypothetical protein
LRRQTGRDRAAGYRISLDCERIFHGDIIAVEPAAIAAGKHEKRRRRGKRLYFTSEKFNFIPFILSKSIKNVNPLSGYTLITVE